MTDTPAEREDSSIWADLRRRRVVQWALAYAAGAWVLLQVLGFVSDSFAWPVTVKQIATILLAIGLPIVVVLGWYHGDRGQRVTGSELAVLTLLLLIGGGLLWLYAQRSVPTTTSTEAVKPAPASAGTDARPSIAVLPFENRSDVQKDAFFVDGIHDDILTQLSKVSALRVISRTSVERFRDTKLPMKAIADQLGVTKILEGGVQRAGNRVRVTVQLIDAATDAHLWAENYDRELSAANIFAIQSEVAAAIAGALKASLTAGEQARIATIPTQNLDAWNAYQLGKQRMAKRTSGTLADAERFFREAVDLDPTFALAHVGLADTLQLQIAYSGAPMELNQSKAESAVAEALKLDPNLAEAWTSSAGIAQDRRQFDRAEPMFLRAIELNPNYAPTRHWYSVMLTAAGRLDESVAQAERATELDPLSAAIRKDFGTILEEQGRFSEAERHYRRAITIDPSFAEAYRWLAGLKAYARNSFADAVPLAERAHELDSGSPAAFVTLVVLYLELGDDVHVSRLLDAARHRWPDDTPEVSWTFAYRGLLRGDERATSQSAQKLLDIDPRNSAGLIFLRDRDIRAGRPELARARYAQAYPELVAPPSPRIDGSNWYVAIALATVLQKTGEEEHARALLDLSEQFIRTRPRLGCCGFGFADVQIHALRGDKGKALGALREAERAGWRSEWRYLRDFDSSLASIRNEPEFKAIFADIERDMAQQRARLAARPKDAPLELTDASR